MKISVILLSLIWMQVQAGQLYSCIKEAFNTSCKQHLYTCTNNPECSYQLHQNTQHIFLTEKSEVFPTLYFSNKLAADLYKCLKSICQLPPMDESYPKTLPFDSCLIEMYDICRGDIQSVFQNPSSSSSEAACYRQYCTFPNLAHK